MSRSVPAMAAGPAPEAAPRILVVLPRGEAIRNFVYSGALDELAEGSRVRVLSVVPSESFRQHIEERHGSLLELTERADPWPVRFVREMLELAHGRSLWSAAARARWNNRDREANAPLSWMKRRIKKIGAMPLANPAGLALLSAIESRASRRAAPTRFYLELLRGLSPSLLFNGSHSHSAMAIDAVHAARSLGIPTATFLFSWDNLTSQGRIIPEYDFYLVWNESIREQLLALYPATEPENVFVTGTPQFDFHFRPENHWTRREFCERVGADPARPIVVYTTGTPGLMPGEPAIVEGLARILRTMTSFGPPQLLVRVYAKDTTGRFEEFRRRNPDVLMPQVHWNPRWFTPEPEDAAMLTNTLRHAAAGVNVASTISLELCMFDKPVINIGYNPPGAGKGARKGARKGAGKGTGTVPVDFLGFYDYEHYRPVTASGAVDVVTSEEKLEKSLLSALTRPERQSEARKKLTQRFFGEHLDGRSASRVAACLLHIASAAGESAGGAAGETRGKP